jgi:DNA-binding transcriptional MerR regulator
MNFVEESNLTQEVQPMQEDQPVNVGVRLKKLKNSDSELAITVSPEPAGEVVTESATENNTNDSSVNIPAADATLKLRSGRGRKSIRQIAEEADLIQIPEDEILFLKQYYTMGEVAEMFRVNQSLLRFWEAEFSILQPKKNKKGDRYFRPIDIKNLHLIYHLLRQRKYTIEGAKDFLRKNSKAEEKFETIKKLEEVKRFLLEIRANLR